MKNYLNYLKYNTTELTVGNTVENIEDRLSQYTNQRKRCSKVLRYKMSFRIKENGMVDVNKM